MLICCVKQGTKYGSLYVKRLESGLRRHTSLPFRFICLTDDPVAGIECLPLPMDLPTWWAKLGIFALKEPLLYFDLDVVIVGDLAPLFSWPGFGIIKDWVLPGFNSSVMRLTGNEGFIYDEFKPEWMQMFPVGDQQYISAKMPDAPTFPSHWFPSFKINHCRDAIPEGAIAVIFHGKPSPQESGSMWVKELWG